MQWKTPTRIAAVVCGTVIVVAVVITATISGAEMTPTEVISVALAGLGSLLAGIGAAAGPSPRGGGAAVLLAAGLAVSGCSGAQLSHSEACEAQAAVVGAVATGVEAASGFAPADGEWSSVVRGAEATVDLGRAATRGCELHRTGAGWQQWLGLALETTAALAARFGGAADEGTPSEPPVELTAARTALEAELAAAQ
jgi:hypothetical protein